MRVRAEAMLSRLAGREVGRRELYLLGAALGVGVVLRLTFALATHDHLLVGDEQLYDRQVRLMLEGKLFYDLQPTGVAHATAVKPPGYPVFLTVLFALTGSGATRAAALQTLLIGPVVIFLGWLLAARLFARPAVALGMAWGMALYPNIWRWEMRFYPEAPALLLALLFFILVLTRVPTRRVVVAVGLLVGASLLVRPTSVFLVPGLLAAWWVMVGFRRAAKATLVAVAVAVVTIVPWTARNYVVLDGFVPLSLQDAAGYGTFNPEAAADSRQPWAWRPLPAQYRDIIPSPKGMSDAEWQRALRRRTFEFIADHPDSVPKAFWWNGIKRTWNVQRPSNAVLGAPDTGPAYVGLVAYWVLLVLALLGLWRFRSTQPALVVTTVVLAFGASLVFTSVANTRYRVPLEPLVLLLAVATVTTTLGAGRRPASRPAGPASPR